MWSADLVIITSAVTNQLPLDRKRTGSSLSVRRMVPVSQPVKWEERRVAFFPSGSHGGRVSSTKQPPAVSARGGSARFRSEYAV